DGIALVLASGLSQSEHFNPIITRQVVRQHVFEVFDFLDTKFATFGVVGFFTFLEKLAEEVFVIFIFVIVAHKEIVIGIVVFIVVPIVIFGEIGFLEHELFFYVSVYDFILVLILAKQT